jgi:CRP/FNR family transcriptional regulator
MTTDSATLLQRFPALQHLDAPSREHLLTQASLHRHHTGERLFLEGDSCNYFILLLSGSLRIQKLTDSGHEIVLYHIKPGQSCRLTNTCLVGGQRYPAEAVAETDVELLRIPKTAFKQAFEQSTTFRSEILASIDVAISNLVRLVEEVAFGHLDQRLAQLLLERSHQNPSIRITHQQLAVELGTAREVVSRLLKEFERHGWLRLQRGSIDIIEPDKLAEL